MDDDKRSADIDYCTAVFPASGPQSSGTLDEYRRADILSIRHAVGCLVEDTAAWLCMGLRIRYHRMRFTSFSSLPTSSSHSW